MAVMTPVKIRQKGSEGWSMYKATYSTCKLVVLVIYRIYITRLPPVSAKTTMSTYWV